MWNVNVERGCTAFIRFSGISHLKVVNNQHSGDISQTPHSFSSQRKRRVVVASPDACSRNTRFGMMIQKNSPSNWLCQVFRRLILKALREPPHILASLFLLGEQLLSWKLLITVNSLYRSLEQWSYFLFWESWITLGWENIGFVR